MRILVFNWRDITHPWAGGAELNIHEQAKRWVQMGHPVTLFCGEFEGSQRHETIDGTDIVRRGGRFTVYIWAVFYYLLYFRGHFDIIIDIENGIPFFTPLYSRLPKVCIAHHVHTEQFRTEFSPPLSWIGIFMESRIMPLVYKRVQFITISKGSRSDLVSIGVNPEKCSVVYCGLDHDIYHPSDIKTDNPSLIYLGRLMRYKRVDLLVEFMRSILKESPTVVLNIVGFGPTWYELKQLISKYGLEDHIIVHGHVSEPQKVRLLQQAWALVIASMNEGWGLVAVEANACGTPAIAFRVPGLCEAIDNPHSGFLVENEEEFLDRVFRILQDSQLREKMEIAAINHAKEFNWNKTAERSLEIMESVIDEPRIKSKTKAINI